MLFNVASGFFIAFMKEDKLTASLINFFIPIIFLYGLYFLISLFEISGFFALIYLMILFMLAIMMYQIVHSSGLKAFENYEIISFTFSLFGLFYILAIVLLLTNFFKL